MEFHLLILLEWPERVPQLSGQADVLIVLEYDGDLCSDDCECRGSLELAVWTNPEAIDKRHDEMMEILRR